MNFNRVIVGGNVTRDIEVRHTAGGAAVAEIGLAVNRKWSKDGSQREETTFVDVTLWGRLAEVAGEYLSKGRPVLIEGRLQLDTWEDRQTGQRRSKLKVVGEHLQLIGSRRDGDRWRIPAAGPEFTAERRLRCVFIPAGRRRHAVLRGTDADHIHHTAG